MYSGLIWFRARSPFPFPSLTAATLYIFHAPSCVVEKLVSPEKRAYGCRCDSSLAKWIWISRSTKCGNNLENWFNFSPPPGRVCIGGSPSCQACLICQQTHDTESSRRWCNWSLQQSFLELMRLRRSRCSSARLAAVCQSSSPSPAPHQKAVSQLQSEMNYFSSLPTGTTLPKYLNDAPLLLCTEEL